MPHTAAAGQPPPPEVSALQDTQQPAHSFNVLDLSQVAFSREYGSYPNDPLLLAQSLTAKVSRGHVSKFGSAHELAVVTTVQQQ